MAVAVLCRCKDHKPRTYKLHRYTYITEPIGYPDTSSICGIRNCNNSGFVYMTDDAVAAYNAGRRIFNYATYVTQVRVKDMQPQKI